MRRRFEDKLWIPFQGLAVATLILTPLLVHRDFQRVAPKILTAVISRDNAVRAPDTITSRVIALPDPSAAGPADARREFAIDTRQFRFERSLASRVPASLGASPSVDAGKDRNPQWSLARILRRTDADSTAPNAVPTWEEVDLVHDGNVELRGSVYLELLHDTDEFMVVYADRRASGASGAKGPARERKVPLRVRFRPRA